MWGWFDVGGSGSATSLNERINDDFVSHFFIAPASPWLDPDSTPVTYDRLSRKVDISDVERGVVMRDADAARRDMFGDAKRVLLPRRTGINLDMDDMLFYCLVFNGFVVL